MIFYIVFGIIITIIYRYWSSKRQQHYLKPVPYVSGALPIIGHGLQFDPTNLDFIAACQHKYGKIFRIKLFITDIIIITDRSLLEEYYKFDESKLSFVQVLINSFLGAGISSKDEFVNTTLNIVKTSLKIDYDICIPKIKNECDNMIKSLRKDTIIDVNTFVRRFIISSSAKCFLAINLDDNLYAMLLHYVDLLGKIFISSAILPRCILNITAAPLLKYYRKNIVNAFKPIIDTYRNNSELCESMILRKSVDHTDQLTDDQIGGIMVSTIFASYGSTVLGLSAMINDLIANPEYWYRIREETQPYIESNDFRGMLKNAKLLDACFWETCRFSSSLLTVLRYAATPNESVGGYHLEQNTLIGFCAPLLMTDEQNTENVFQNPQKYDPERFLPPRNEKISTSSIVTFGGGRHRCPGRDFAMMEILMGVAHLTNHFEPFRIVDVSKAIMMTAGGFVERKMFMVAVDKK